MSRQKELPYSEIFTYSKEDARFGTPKIIAEYRAKKLKCNKLVEVGCSVGFQTSEFSKLCKKIIAVEIEKDKIERAKENMKKINANNVEFIFGDILDKKTQEKIAECDNIFLDTGRPPQEKSRNIENISPNLQDFLKWAKTKTENIYIEIPPHLKEVPFDCTREYVSYEHKINRSHLLFGKFKTTKTKAVTLPSREEIEGNPRQIKENKLKLLVNNYISEIDPALIFSELVYEILPENTTIKEENKYYALTKTKKKTNFLTYYKIQKIIKKQDFEKIRQIKAQRIIQHNSNLKIKHQKGDETVHLFCLKEGILVCKKD